MSTLQQAYEKALEEAGKDNAARAKAIEERIIPALKELLQGADEELRRLRAHS